MQEDKPAPAFDSDWVEIDRTLVESRHAPQMRRSDETSVEVVRPLMIRAQNGTPGDHAALHGCTREPRWRHTL